MKKILLTLFSFTLVVSSMTSVVSCSIGDIDGSKWLSSLGDYDWETNKFGDRMKSENIEVDKDQQNQWQNNDQGLATIENKGNYFNYSKFSTGYQWEEAIKKQAVTGAPTNKIFMPGGNLIGDFGISSKAQKYKVINNILDWNPNVDIDSKYNVSSIDKKVSKNVAVKTVATQDENIKSAVLQFTSFFHRSATNTNVGIKNPFDNNFSQWQYLNDFINWGGSYYEGVVLIPGADAIDAAHANGVNMFANIFLDGYHGLSRRMAKDLFKKNNEGEYIFADKMIEMAEYYGFDGYYWNNEPNGSLPNGSILDYHEVYDLLKQFEEKKNKSTNPKVKNLKIKYYNNGSQLGTSDPSDSHNVEGEVMSEVVDDISDNFGSNANEIKSFIGNNPRWQKDNKQYDIYTLASMASNSLNGFYDVRNLTNYHYDSEGNRYTSSSKDKAREDKDRKSMGWTFKKEEKPLVSFSFYEDNGGASYGEIGLNDALNSEEFKAGKITEAQANLYAQQVSHIFDQFNYLGRNRFLKGSSTNNDLDDNTVDHGFYEGFPVGINSKDTYESLDILTANNKKDKKDIDFEKDEILNKKDKRGDYVYSFGQGNVKMERTVIVDENPSLTTNFSTGSGIKFVSNNGINIENYPWTNKRLTDVQPTYPSDLRIYKDNVKGMDLENVVHNQGSGFYDYYNVYKKGNSIALAKSLNIDGSINPMSFKKGQKLLWNIMGTNLSDKNHQIEMVVKSKDIKNNFDLKMAITTSDDRILILNTTANEDRNGWTRLSSNMNELSLNTNEKIAKVSLLVEPKNDLDAILNLGEFSIDNPEISSQDLENMNITNLKIEYLIERQNENFIRFGWDNNQSLEPKWTEIYVMDKNGKVYRAGETTQEIYYIRKIHSLEGLKIGIKPIYNNENVNKIFWFGVNA